MQTTMLLAGIAAVVAAGNATGSGEEASYTFSKPPVGSLGVQSLAELRGKPVLIDFWGTR
jgi:hypothetical protein